LAAAIFRGTDTPSFMGTPWPSALGRRECVPWTTLLGAVGALGVVGVGAGDWERGDAEVAGGCGGPRDQADVRESCGGSFCDVAVEDLLILRMNVQSANKHGTRREETMIEEQRASEKDIQLNTPAHGAGGIMSAQHATEDGLG
jgi:hypothetical protein